MMILMLNGGQSNGHVTGAPCSRVAAATERLSRRPSSMAAASGATAFVRLYDDVQRVIRVPEGKACSTPARELATDVHLAVERRKRNVTIISRPDREGPTLTACWYAAGSGPNPGSHADRVGP